MEAIQEQRNARINRLKWHCRRALLELDLIFTRFWERQGDILDLDKEQALRNLLALEDHDLWALVSGKVTPEGADSARDALLMELRRLD